MTGAIKSFNQKNLKIKDGMVNRRADQGFNAVIDLFSSVLGERCVGVEKELLQKKLRFDGFRYITELDLRYIVENRLWERSFNLELSSDIPVTDAFAEIGDCLFEAVAKGGLGIKSLTWRCVRGNLDDGEQARYLERLSIPLITARIKALDLSHIKLEHREGSGTWRLTCQSMIGSTTWVLIPPILQTIKPRPDEVAQLLEFLELAADAVINNQP